jgi:phosphate starvation-inducible PhoH-like protein
MKKSRNNTAKRSYKNQYDEDEFEKITINIDDLEKEKKKTAIGRAVINKDLKPKTPKQKELLKAIHENQIVFVKGAAGTGKTLIALKAAVEIIKKDTNSINTILLTKPIVEAGESIGFLPGGIHEKTDPYMESFISNMGLIIGKASTKNFLDNKVMESNPLPFMRGDTFRNSIAILDEAQNTTITGLKLFLSRVGGDSKLVIIGDSDQTDLILKGDAEHGLSDAFKRFKGLDGVAFVEFTEDDIVRSEILKHLMKRYNKQ